MSSSDSEQCGYDYDTDEGVCTEEATFSDGRCAYHTDVKHDEEKSRSNYEHGLYSSEYYESLPEPDQNFIDAVGDDLLEKSYYDKEDTAMVEKCRQIAIDLHQKRRADGYIAKKGMTQENTVGVHETYGEITETEENTLFITKDRLSRESRLAMKDLGIMDQDKKETGETSAVLEQLSKEA